MADRLEGMAALVTTFIGFIRGAYLVQGKNWAHPHASPAAGLQSGLYRQDH